jgi:acetamidase/formamidase
MATEAQTIEIKPDSYSYVFNPYREAIARVSPGDRTTIHTDDAFESRIKSKEDLPSRALATAKFLNPQTGPIYVEGAEPGDTLAVRIESIEPTRDYAVSTLVPYFGGLTSTNFTRTLQDPLPEKVWIWNLVDGGRVVNDELDVELDWEPFVGTLAVAPDLEAISALSRTFWRQHGRAGREARKHRVPAGVERGRARLHRRLPRPAGAGGALRGCSGDHLQGHRGLRRH